MSEEERAHEEIIIVRRSYDDHDDHHGGAWKVAFADFMTAMMAFFLVMWLINSSSEETKKAVASYFNPIKLTDRISNPKGLRTPKYGDISDEELEIEEKSTVISNSKVITIKGDGVAKTFDEQALFSDPYALLAEISSGLDTGAKNENSEDKMVSRSSNHGFSGGDAFRDPFDPSSWKMNNENNDHKNEQDKLEEQLDEQIEPIESNKDNKKEFQEYSKNTELNKTGDTDLEKSETKKTGDTDLEKSEVEKAEKPELNKIEKIDKINTMIADGKKSEIPESQLLEIMRKEIQEIVSQEGKNAPDVQIRGDKSGTVITLFDKNKSGMFRIGSARPSPEMVRIMKKIGELLSREKGKIIVGGHTDGRKFKSKTYDNWRLSTARAHMAYHMLVRGGVPETRFEMISGFGSVKLAMPDDPYSPVNRRIEISLRVT